MRSASLQLNFNSVNIQMVFEKLNRYIKANWSEADHESVTICESINFV